MPEKTEAQKKAQKKYMEKFVVAQVRMERSKYECIQDHAAACGQSVNAYINEAIGARMAGELPPIPQDRDKGRSDAAQGPLGGGVISIHSESEEAKETAHSGAPAKEES